MGKGNRRTRYKQTVEIIDPTPLQIVPLSRIDRLERVKDWLRLGRGPTVNLFRYKFPDKVATIVARTYAECGDGASLSDDIALMRIRDLLLELDEGIIRRNARKIRG